MNQFIVLQSAKMRYNIRIYRTPSSEFRLFSICTDVVFIFHCIAFSKCNMLHHYIQRVHLFLMPDAKLPGLYIRQATLCRRGPGNRTTAYQANRFFGMFSSAESCFEAPCDRRLLRPVLVFVGMWFCEGLGVKFPFYLLDHISFGFIVLQIYP
jgi:hypothetical protein